MPDLVEDDPDQPHHPFKYFAHCPHCGAENQPQAAWERALLKAHQHSTGPKTPEGLAASAANIAGHPTPHETLRTRFNAMKHGASARTAKYFPAKAGGYSFCARCDVDRDWCNQQPACVKQTETFMLHMAAFEQRDPKVLTALHADMHAALMATLQMCIQEVLGLGVLIKAPKVELDRDGNPVTLTYTGDDGQKRYIYNYSSNPAFKPLTELITRLGLSMSDLGMTVKATDEDAERNLGKLQLDESSKETLSAFGQRMVEATENARLLIQQAQKATKEDPVLLEHQARSGDK
ncbi:hypothetical protein KW843_07385 [Acidovorax sp. sif1233]|uniref:hypothetical protein n=1 Tax=Acidovorax sp. sif1233 TaxID=2854792 RepID=UPI001C490BDF|nr:hypothetical protein [Acidovorax sp. sif1233]MBV7454289.1 hypothetical protein [Acidovorax sp. sif1233]